MPSRVPANDAGCHQAAPRHRMPGSEQRDLAAAAGRGPGRHTEWLRQIDAWRAADPMVVPPHPANVIIPQYAIQRLHHLLQPCEGTGFGRTQQGHPHGMALAIRLDLWCR